MHRPVKILALLWLTALASAGITQKDFTGTGNIYVLNSSDWRTASPTEDKIGCLSESGKLITSRKTKACGTFTRMDVFPYTLSTSKGNCTFDDQSQERNTDSKYGQNDHAWNCNATFQSDIYDQLYTIVSSAPPCSGIPLMRSGWLPIYIPLLRRRSMLLRRQACACKK